MVHVLYVDISGIDRLGYGKLYAEADAERKRRADRCLRQEDAVRCIAADALLRYAVKESLGVSEFVVEKTALGKPRLQGMEDFHFNLSHSGKWVVIAYGDAEVGVDVEKIHMTDGKAAIARRYFTEDEQGFVFENAAKIPERFFRVWTAKESYLKYLGTGLHRRMDSFSVLSSPAAQMLYSRLLDEDYWLTLCTDAEQPVFDRLDAKRLLGIHSENA